MSGKTGCLWSVQVRNEGRVLYGIGLDTGGGGNQGPAVMLDCNLACFPVSCLHFQLLCLYYRLSTLLGVYDLQWWYDSLPRRAYKGGVRTAVWTTIEVDRNYGCVSGAHGQVMCLWGTSSRVDEIIFESISLTALVFLNNVRMKFIAAAGAWSFVRFES